MEWFKKIIEKSTNETGNIDIQILIKEFNKEFTKNAIVKTNYDEAVNELEKIKNELIEKNAVIADFEKIDINGMKDEILKLKENEKNIIKNNAIDLALIKAGAKNLKAAKALIDIDEDFDENTINEKIESLSQDEESAFLFSKNNSFVGFKPFEGESEMNKNIDEMSYSEMCKFLENNNL